MDGSELTKSRSGHGGDIYTDRSVTWLDLSANINPRPLPPEVEAALPGILNTARAYPDIEYEELRQELARYAANLSHTEISPDWILPGNGAVEVLDKAIAAARGILIVRPCFSEYELSCVRHGIPFETLDRTMDQQAVLGEDFFRQLRRKLEQGISEKARAKGIPFDTLVLCNPNNPDGKIYDKTEVEALLNWCAGQGIRLIIDETFGEYLEDGEMLLPLVSNHKNLIIVKALTKFFGLPGVRLGYGITSDPAFRQAITEGFTTWNVGAFAQGIARILMRNDDFIASSQASNKMTRAWLTAELSAIGRIEQVFPSSSSFIMVYARQMPELIRNLKAHHILIRDLSRMPGLGEGYARIAVKDRTCAEQLIAALKIIDSEKDPNKMDY